jgi:hypothetical protein
MVARQNDVASLVQDAANQVTLASDQVTLAANQVTLAEAAAAAASSAANASIWISGQTYSAGVVRYSPVNFLSYRRKVTGAGTTDPSVDTANWALTSGTGDVTVSGVQTLENKTLISPAITENVQIINTNTTAVRSRTYVMTTALTLLLPPNPEPGDKVAFSNWSDTKDCVIARNGQNIMKKPEDMTVDNVNYFATLVFADATRGWVFQ